ATLAQAIAAKLGNRAAIIDITETVVDCDARLYAPKIPIESAAASTIKGLDANRDCGRTLIRCLPSAFQVNDRFDVMRLREHIKCSERVNSITTVGKLFQITRERRGIARHVANVLRAQLNYASNNTRFSAGAGRIKQKKIRPAQFEILFQPARDILVCNF